MDPTAAFVLALIAIVVSGASALFAGISVHQTKKYRPKADLTVTWEKDVTWSTVPSIPLTYVTVTNHGDGTAREIRVSLDNARVEGSDLWREFPVIDPGLKVQIEVPLWDNVTEDDIGDWTSHSVPAVTVFPTLTLSWRKESGHKRATITKSIEGDGWKPFGM